DRRGEWKWGHLEGSAREEGISEMRVRVRLLRSPRQQRVRRLGRPRTTRPREAAGARIPRSRRRPRFQRSGFLELRRAWLRRAEWIAVRVGADSKSLRRAKVHSADPGWARRQGEGEVQRRSRGA